MLTYITLVVVVVVIVEVVVVAAAVDLVTYVSGLNVKNSFTVKIYSVNGRTNLMILMNKIKSLWIIIACYYPYSLQIK